LESDEKQDYRKQIKKKFHRVEFERTQLFESAGRIAKRIASHLTSLAARLFSLRRISIELEGSGIDAVAQSGRSRAILEYVTEVRVAAGAQHFYPPHEMAVIFLVDDIFRSSRLPERRPPRTGIEFGLRVKQGGATAGATIHPLIVAVPVFPCERPFRPFFAAYMILLRGQLVFPFLVRFNKLAAHNSSSGKN